MASVTKSIFRLADKIARTEDVASSSTRARVRALVIWTIFAVPTGVLLILMSQDFNLTRASAVSLGLGASGMFAAIWRLRHRQDIEEASTIFICSAVIGLGGSAWIDPSPPLVPLIFLAATPVYFGLIVRWRKCLAYTTALLVYYFALAFWLSLKDPTNSALVLCIMACGLAALGTGLSTTAYANTTERAARKVSRQAREIASIAYNCPLTGIANRRAFKDAMEADLATGEIETMALIDLDRFKAINDTHGHEVGDQILKEFAARLSEAMGEQSTVYRLGGDEFVSLADDRFSNPDALGSAICKLVDRPFPTEIGALSIALSVGIASARYGAHTLKHMFREADTALYEAKRFDGSGWITFCHSLGDAAERRTKLTELLKQTLEHGDLDVDYQPQFDLRTKQILGFEALARWRIDEFGRVSPGEFVPIAERANLITKLDQTVFKKAVAEAEDWLTAGQKISVNVSGSTLLSQGFVDFAERVVASSSLHFEQVQIEITESEIIKNREVAVEICQQLGDLGFSIALDDFGTGYSSLSYLSALPVNTLKVDRSFVQHCDGESNLKILKSVIGLARSLGLSVVVEGVEREWQLKVVEALGCRCVQGFYFSRPVSAEQCAELNFTASERHERPAPNRASA